MRFEGAAARVGETGLVVCYRLVGNDTLKRPCPTRQGVVQKQCCTEAMYADSEHARQLDEAKKHMVGPAVSIPFQPVWQAMTRYT